MNRYNENTIPYLSHLRNNVNAFSSILYTESQPPTPLFTQVRETDEEICYSRHPSSFKPWLNFISMETDVIFYMEKIVSRVVKWRHTILGKKESVVP